MSLIKAPDGELCGLAQWWTSFWFPRCVARPEIPSLWGCLHVYMSYVSHDGNAVGQWDGHTLLDQLQRTWHVSQWQVLWQLQPAMTKQGEWAMTIICSLFIQLRPQSSIHTISDDDLQIFREEAGAPPSSSLKIDWQACTKRTWKEYTAKKWLQCNLSLFLAKIS